MNFISYSNMTYEVLERILIYDLHLTIFAEIEPLEIISVNCVHKGFQIVLDDDIKLDCISKGGYDMQQLTPSEYDSILFPKLMHPINR